MKHKITINVTDRCGKKSTVIKGASTKLPERILKFLFGDFTQVYLLAPGQSVISVDVNEMKEGGKPYEQRKITT